MAFTLITLLQRSNKLKFFYEIFTYNDTVSDLDKSIDFYTNTLGLKLVRKKDYPHGKFTLAFLSVSNDDPEPFLELTYNWDKNSYTLGNAFGHIA